MAMQPTRREFVRTAGALAAGVCGDWTRSFGGAFASAEDAAVSAEARKKLPRIASINSIYAMKSHAYHICGRFLHGYSRNGFTHRPPFRLARMFNDQTPAGDLSRSHCSKHDIELCQSVADALGGEKTLDVDAVLLIVEHGDYPVNKFNQILYPRYELFEKIVDVFRKSDRSVPVFIDKHLSYDHQLAHKMVATARELGFPLMAGSSLPVTWRQPEIEPPLETPFSEGLVALGYDRGPAEIYLFHGLETLQCMLERRRGGETGVKSVTCLEGAAVWRAADEGRWSWQLLRAALARCPSNNLGDVRDNVLKPLAILVEYNDGTKGTVLNLPEQISEFGFAATVRGELDPVSTLFHLPPPPRAGFFDPLTYNIEKFFTNGRAPYPVERTLLTSTVLDLAMHSQYEAGKTRTDAALQIRYEPPAETGFFRGPITAPN